MSMNELDHWLKEFSRKFKNEVERDDLHKQKYHDDDESVEAEQW